MKIRIAIKLVVERNRKAQKRIDDVRVSVKLFVNHQSQNAHLCCTAIVQFNSELLLQRGLVPAGSFNLRSLDLLLANSEASFKNANKSNQLESSSSRNCFQGTESTFNGRKRNSGSNICEQSIRDNFGKIGKRKLKPYGFRTPAVVTK